LEGEFVEGNTINVDFREDTIVFEEANSLIIEPEIVA
jgi:hypothetical protein